MRLEKRHLVAAVVLAAAGGFSAPRAEAVNLQMSFNASASDVPSYDPDGARLRTLMGSVESYLEDIFEQSWTLQVEFYYTEFDGGILAMCTSQASSGGKPTRCRIQVDVGRTWYFDPTPLENDEYTMTQTLFRDLSSSQQTAQFNGTPNGLLEVSYNGSAKASAPADARGGFDLFSVLLHEMGHGLGMNGLNASGEVSADSDYDFDPQLIWGGAGAARSYATDNQYHLAASASMYPSFGTGSRRLYSATDVLAIQAGPEWTDTTIDLGRKDFYSANATADFNLRGNWEGNKAPDAADAAYVRHGGTATLSASASAGSLLVTAGSAVSLGARTLTIGGACTVGGTGTTGRIDVGAGGQLRAATLDVKAGAQVNLDGGGGLDVESLLLAGGATLSGGGTVDVGTLLRNDGTIQTGGAALGLTTASTGAVFDLDGSGTSGKVLVTGADLTVGGPLTDAFGGLLHVGAGRTATFAQGWNVESTGTIELAGSGGSPATVAGGLSTIVGRVSVAGGDNRFGGAVTFANSASVQVPTYGDVLTLDGATTFRGGSFTGAGRIVQKGQATFANSGTSRLDADYHLRGRAFVEAGAKLSGEGDFVIESPGTLVLQDGAIFGVNVFNGGWLSPGAPVGSTTLQGDLTMDGGVLAIDLLSPTVFDRLAVLGSARLADTLEISLLGGYVPEAGAQFTILTFASRSGTFDEVLFDGAPLVPVYSATALTLYAAAPGDANLDGRVDDVDASILAAHWQQTAGAGWGDGDFNGDGHVNDLDASLLAHHWQGDSSSALAVPEPGAVVLLAGLLAMRFFVGGSACRANRGDTTAE